MAKLLNSSQTKWMYFCNNESATAKLQVAVPIGSEASHFQIKSAAATVVTVVLKEAGHAGTLPVLGTRKDCAIELGCDAGNAPFIIKTFMKWIAAAGTDAIDPSNQRFLEFTGKNASVSSIPAMFDGKIKHVKVDFNAAA
tara:strand:- start:2089 stop:2508 length:420 start_codon:yes stop_codon:yes gene_type:complete